MAAQMLDGVEHLGTLCLKLRGHRSSSEFDVDKGTISKFENTGKSMGVDAFTRFVNGLNLFPDQRELLLYKFYPHSQDRELRHNQRMLCKVSFRTTRDRADHEYARLISELENEYYPSYIADPLWFVHALNQPLLDLFGITKGDLETHSDWWVWHGIGSKYHPKSKIGLQLKDDMYSYVPNVLQKFFNDTSQYFFTAHMRALRNRLWNLSDSYKREWSTLISFQGGEPRPATLMRVMEPRNSKPLVLDVMETPPTSIDVGEGDRVNYRRIQWIPRDKELWKSLREDLPGEEKIHFAADYIEDYNDWPEIKQYCASYGTKEQ